MNMFKSLWYLGGLDSIDPRVHVADAAFGQAYGNRVASGKAFRPFGRSHARPRASTANAASARSATQPCHSA